MKRDEWDSYMVVRESTGQWCFINGVLELCRMEARRLRALDAVEPRGRKSTYDVIPVRIVKPSSLATIFSSW